jgi:transglutaminase-like putative cysteine protease
MASDGQKERQNGPEITLKVTGAKAAAVTMKWSKAKGAEKYRLYRSVNSKKRFRKYKTFSGTKRKFTDKKLSLKKNYYYIVEADVPGEKTQDDGDDTAAGTEILSNIIVKAKVRGSYKPGTVYGPGLSKGQLRVLRDEVAGIVNKYQASEMSAYDKISFAHDYIAARTSYSTGGAQVSSALGPLKYGKAHCQGYSRAFVCLCSALGVKSRYVHASAAASNPAHQWNMVKYKKKWYLTDVQCNDSSGADVVFLMGKDRLKGFFKRAYRYNGRGLPALAKKSCPARKYYFKFK